MTDQERLIHQIAVECGAVTMGDPPHYLMTAGQLELFVREAQWTPDLPAPPSTPLISEIPAPPY